MAKYDNIDFLLENTLKPEYTPSDELQMELIRKAKERKDNMRRIKPARVAAAVACASLLVGVTSVAAYKYMTPSQVATEIFETNTLADAFEKEDAIKVNESQVGDGYKFTLLGITSGKGLNPYIDEEGNKVEENESYAVIAIENADGSPLSDSWEMDGGFDKFMMSPFIGGENVWQVNIFSLDGGAFEIERNGIAYRIISCSNLNVFADRGVYIGISDNTFDFKSTYNNEADGTITRNENYDGLNLLFKLPLDANKADRNAADELLKQITGDVDYSAKNEEEIESLIDLEFEEDTTKYSVELYKRLDRDEELTEDEIKSKCHILEDSIVTIPADSNGVYMINTTERYDYLESEVADKDGKLHINGYSYDYSSAGLEINTYRYNSDGTVTFALYKAD